MSNSLGSDINLLHTQSYAASEKNKIIAFEGMPGAGKTIVLSSIAEDSEGACILLSEMNLEPHSLEPTLSAEKQKDIFHKQWIERMHLLTACKGVGLCFLLDRSYFSNLAFVYALDSMNKTSYYPLYKEIFKKDFSDHVLDLIMVLDIRPETSLERRHLRGDKIPQPWADLTFLQAMREFYTKELHNISRKKIKYVNAEKGISELKKEIKSELNSAIKKEYIFPSLDSAPHNQIKALFDFAAINKLGKASTRLINVLGVPTLYFLKHSIQLKQGQPIFFNNTQLNNILYRHNLLTKI